MPAQKIIEQAIKGCLLYVVRQIQRCKCILGTAFDKCACIAQNGKLGSALSGLQKRGFLVVDVPYVAIQDSFPAELIATIRALVRPSLEMDRVDVSSDIATGSEALIAALLRALEPALAVMHGADVADDCGVLVKQDRAMRTRDGLRAAIALAFVFLHLYRELHTLFLLGGSGRRFGSDRRRRAARRRQRRRSCGLLDGLLRRRGRG